MGALEKLKERYRWISKFESALSLLHWDLEVNMPPKAAPYRAEVIGEIAGFVFEKTTDEEMGRLIEEAEGEVESDIDKALVKMAKRDYERYKKIPKELYVEFQIETAKAQKAWEEAKKRSDFSLFAPNFEKIVDLVKKIAEHVGYEKDIYDTLLDFYEPGLTSDMFQRFVDDLKGFLVDMVSKIESSEKPKDVFKGNFDVDKQKELSLKVLKTIGYDLDAGRLDSSAHPFTISIGVDDTRVTTRFKVDDLKYSFYSTLHEGGHALYDQGIPKEFKGLPIGDGASMAVHESQSRFWENVVGRSLEFWEFFKPTLEKIFPDFKNVSIEDLWRASNIVERSLIRTEADEVTYNLHIMLRFELERAIVNDELKVRDLPSVWNEKMKEYLGIVPKNDSEGVLQDVHWAHGSFGYFPSYMLGNLYAAHILKAMKKELAFKDLVKFGKFEEVLSWLRDKIHSKGRTIFPLDLIKEATGEEFSVDGFKEYIEEKYSSLYGI